MKMVFDYNETMNTAVASAAGITVQVAETEEEYKKYMVITSTGIRKVIYSWYDFQSCSKNDIECWLVTTAIGYFEMLNTRLKKQKAESEPELEEITE